MKRDGSLDKYTDTLRKPDEQRVVCHVDMDCFYCEKRGFPYPARIEDSVLEPPARSVFG